MDDQDLTELYDAQAGVVSRAQLLRLGADDNDIRRMCRQRLLARVHPGVYVNHTGPLTWVTRAWAAVVFYGEAALCHRSAVDLAGEPIHVAIEHPRNAVSLPGVRLHRLSNLHARVRWNTGPPRLRIEEAALDVAADAPSSSDAVAVLAGVCQRRMTRPDRLLAALEQRQRLSHGHDLRQVLLDVAAGADSVLERCYLRRVERAHRLPPGERQAPRRSGGRVVYRDVLYRSLGLVVELDGWGWHSSASARWDDMSRDLDAAVEGHTTIRLGWRHAREEACMTAVRLGALMRRLGWGGEPVPCGRDCVLSGGSQSRGA